MYSIDEPPTDPSILASIVGKHMKTVDIFLASRPIADHTKNAYDQLSEYLQRSYAITQNDGNSGPSPPLILDSGCGTGRSSLILGKKYPNHLVLGVDRSIARLSRNAKYDMEVGALVQQAADNVLLIQADLTDFWRLFLTNDRTIDYHYLLYPNPYPKPRRLKSRFYAHPSFPLLLQLNAKKIVVRSNWDEYLRDFSNAVQFASLHSSIAASYRHRGPERVRLDESQPEEEIMTNFEAKYLASGEPIYELELTRE